MLSTPSLRRPHYILQSSSLKRVCHVANILHLSIHMVEDTHGNFRLELELTVMVISKFCWYDCWYSVGLLSKNEKIVIGKRERLPIIIMHHWQCIIRLISRKLQTKRIITSKCVFAKCFINVLGKDLILGERKKRECIKFKKNSQQSKKSLYSGTGSTVRVCPNFPEERGLPYRL